jgi:hypothetical protein
MSVQGGLLYVDPEFRLIVPKDANISVMFDEI